MRIKSIYIGAFGAFKDYTLDLDDGMQVIYGENEAGKTTVTEFIKAMFYGTGKRAAGQIMSIREKYSPFDGTQACGRIVYERGGRDYCIERQFRKSDATDKVTITDMAAGTTEPCAPDIGRELFGIGVGAFERSVFIGNTPDITADDNSQGEINQRLSNAALAGGDDVSCQKVLKRIDDARLKIISKSGRTGSKIADISECNALSEALAETDRLARKKQELTAALASAEEDLKKITAEYDEIQKVLASAKDIENAQKLKEYLELKGQLDEITAKLTLGDGTVADEMFLKKLEFAFSKLDNMRGKIEAAKRELEGLASAAGLSENSPDQIRAKIDEAKAQISECEKQTAAAKRRAEEAEAEIERLEAAAQAAKGAKKAVNLALLIPGIVILAAGLTLFFLNVIKPAAITAGGIGLLLGILAFIIRPLDAGASERSEAALAAKRGELAGIRSEIMMRQSEKSTVEAKIESYNIALNFGISETRKTEEKRAFVESETAALKIEEEKMLKFFGLPEGTDFASVREQTEQLYSLAEEQKKIKIKLSYLSRDLGGISYEEAREKLAASADADKAVDIEELRKKARKLAVELTAAQSLKTQLETELKTGFRGMGDPEDLRRRIEALKAGIEAKQEFYDAASIAYEVLEESFITARMSFGGVLEEETLKNLKALTGGAYGAVTVSKEFDITAEKNGVFGKHELEYLSRGTKDQAYLSLRLAIAKLITEKEPLPVILDDSLSQYDDRRFAAALSFLKTYSRDTQVCLFTCHGFVTEAAQDAGIKVIKI